MLTRGKFYIYYHIPNLLQDGKVRKDGVKNHYDIMLQIDEDKWLAFSTIKKPGDNSFDKIFACFREQIVTIDIEVRKTLNGSHSELYDEGTYVQVNDFEKELALRKPCLRLRFKGNILNGVYRFEKMNDFWASNRARFNFRHEAEGHSWLLIKCVDDMYPEENDYGDSKILHSEE